MRMAESRQSIRAGSGAGETTHVSANGERVGIDYRRYRCEEGTRVVHWIKRTDPKFHRALRLIWTAWTAAIKEGAALADTRRPRQTAAPIGGVAHLPATNHQVFGSADTAEVRLSFPEGKFVHGTEHPDLVAIEIDRTPCNWVTDGIVLVRVVVCV